MKNLVTLLILVLGFTMTVNAQVEKTLVKSIALSSSTAVVTLPGTVDVMEWDKDFIRVTTYLTVENMNENIAKQLVIVGRYNLTADIDEATQTLMIAMPNIANQVTVKGVQLVEQLKFEVNAPEGYDIIIKGDNVLENTPQNSMVGQTM